MTYPRGRGRATTPRALVSAKQILGAMTDEQVSNADPVALAAAHATVAVAEGLEEIAKWMRNPPPRARVGLGR